MRIHLIYAGFISIILGIFVPWAGGAAYYQWFFYIVGGGIILGCAYAGFKNNRLESLFITCKLFTEINGKKIMPRVVSKTKLQNGFEYRFTIPTGLCSSDFNQKAQAFSENLNKKVEFKFSNGNLIMKAVDF